MDRQQLWMFGGKEVQIPVVSEMDINVLCALWQSVTTYYDVQKQKHCQQVKRS